MRSLFIKIFFWFWLANILVAAAGVVVAYLIQRPIGSDTSPWRGVAGLSLGRQAQAAVEVLERDGADALPEFLDRWDRASGTHSFLLDASGEDLGGHRLPEDLTQLADKAMDSGTVEAATSEGKTLVAVSVTGLDGKRYVFAHEIPPPLGWPERRPPRPRGGPDGPDDARGPGPGPRGDRRPPHRTDGPPPRRGSPPSERGRPDPLTWVFGEPALLLAILAAVVATSGVVCYALARYLTRPVRVLQGAARRLADGDMSARVGPSARARADEIGDLGRDFDFMAERLQCLLIAQQRLLGDISHELRSPLSRLGVALELARRDSGPAAEPALTRAGREADRLNDLIGQLLTLAELESAGAQPRQYRIDLKAMIEDIAGDAEFEAAARGRHVRIARCDDCEIVGAPELVRSAIENVMRNAIRYTDAGSAVEVTLLREPDGEPASALVEIRDHGPGVPEAALRDIFLPFHRVSDARDRSSGGSGLGLAITDRAIRLHRGSVTAVNAPNGGLVVRIHLPTS